LLSNPSNKTSHINKQNVLLSSLLSKQLISPVNNNKDLLIDNKYENVTHYTISVKGIEYIKKYEYLLQLIV